MIEDEIKNVIEAERTLLIDDWRREGKYIIHMSIYCRYIYVSLYVVLVNIKVIYR